MILSRTLPALLGLSLLLACGGGASSDAGTGTAISTPPPAPSGQKALPMPLISQGLPATASSGDPSQALDADGDTLWRSTGAISAATPAWITVDLASVPATQRQKVLLLWSNGSNYNYDVAFAGDPAYNLPQDYTLEGNAAPGGGPAPDAGWVPLATVTANSYHSRQHLLDLAGLNWLRLRITAVAGSALNMDAAADLELHDASLGANDSWIFFGDSITAFAMGEGGEGLAAPSFARLVNGGNPGSPNPAFTGNPAFFPAEEAAGIGGTKTTDALANIDHWLATFPGRYVGLSYGTNDINGDASQVDPTYQNFQTLVQKVLAAGKVPCVPHVPWAPAPGIQQQAPALNAKLDQLYLQNPKVVRGPDLWTVFFGHPELFRDDLHPNAEGIRLYREAWAKAMLAEVYHP